MAQITRKGRELASKLHKSLGYHRTIAEICSLICRHAVTYDRIQEMYCNGHPLQNDPGIPAKRMAKIQDRFDARLEKREEQLEKRITELVESLPHTDEGPISVSFRGDPRRYTVTLIMPDGNTDVTGFA